MSKSNFFLPVMMSYGDLTTYYPTNDFDHFTFQQVMESGDLGDDSYTLNAFAINTNGITMGPQINLTAISNEPSLARRKLVQFGSVTVYKEDLDYIFDYSSPVTGLGLYPQESDNYGGFVAYKIRSGETLAAIHKVVDPSPPARSH